MKISYSRTRKQPYINFKMRKLIRNVIRENANMNENELSIEIEKIITSNYWVKDMRKQSCTIVNINETKAA